MSLYEDQPTSILNRALVIHANADDLGRGNDPESLKSGNSGAHIACGLVTRVDIEEQPVEVDEQLEHRKHSLNAREFEKKPLKGWEDLSLSSQISSNLDVEGIVKPDMPHDSFELKSSASTHKSKLASLQSTRLL